mmetsp:Transcript_65341/g.168184  ORF Transcript_65341/g.168184 Transcript_65341/m.168184 type:complete len:113 (-) Transcript_65341:276-614(-)
MGCKSSKSTATTEQTMAKEQPAAEPQTIPTYSAAAAPATEAAAEKPAEVYVKAAEGEAKAAEAAAEPEPVPVSEAQMDYLEEAKADVIPSAQDNTTVEGTTAPPPSSFWACC